MQYEERLTAEFIRLMADLAGYRPSEIGSARVGPEDDPMELLKECGGTALVRFNITWKPRALQLPSTIAVQLIDWEFSAWSYRGEAVDPVRCVKRMAQLRADRLRSYRVLVGRQVLEEAELTVFAASREEAEKEARRRIEEGVELEWETAEAEDPYILNARKEEEDGR